MSHDKHIGFEIRTLNNLLKRDFEKSKHDIGLPTGVHGWAIGYFYENRNRDVFQKDFENHFSIRRSTATSILQLMEKNGLITRQSVPTDARLKKITLTEKAINIHKAALEDISQREKRLKRNIDENDIKVFLSVIEQIKLNLEEEEC